MREKYESLSLAVLKELAKSRGLKGISTLKKAALVERMLQEDEKEAQKAHAGEAEHDAEKRSEADKHSESVKHTQTEHKSEKSEHESRKRIYERRERPERRTVNDTEVRMIRKNSRKKNCLKSVRMRHLWTAESREMVFWKLCRTDTDLSVVRIICRVTMMYMWLLLRFVVSI